MQPRFPYLDSLSAPTPSLGVAAFEDIAMHVGTVVSLDILEGFGVIAPEDGTRRVSIRIAPKDRTAAAKLAIGQRVRYDNGYGLFGNVYARNIVRIP
jgi:cold shock CspA family protein